MSAEVFSPFFGFLLGLCGASAIMATLIWLEAQRDADEDVTARAPVKLRAQRWRPRRPYRALR